MTRRNAPDWLTGWEYAHRGLHGIGVPENSLRAAELAVEAGLGIECDIQRSLDGCPMVIHDWELDRLTSASGEIEQRTNDQLQEIKYRKSDERIVALEGLLELVAGRVPLLIEIKSKPGYDVKRTCERVCKDLSKYTGDRAVMSFDPRVARWFRKHDPSTCTGLVMREDQQGETQTAWKRWLALAIAQPDFVAYHVAALPSPLATKLHARGMPLLCWTVNSPEARQRALENVDALISEGEGFQ